MKLIALILGLILERLATELLHLRELRWFDRYFDFAISRLLTLPPWLLYPGVIVVLMDDVGTDFLSMYAPLNPYTGGDRKLWAALGERKLGAIRGETPFSCR